MANKFSTTAGRCYIVELSPPYERLEIQFVPKEFSYGSTAKMAKIEVVGRNNPLHHYTGGDDNLSFQLDFFAEEESRKDVLKKVKWIQSLRYNDGNFAPKKNISIVFGNLFRNEIWTVDSVQVKYSDFDSLHDFLPQQAFVDIKLSLDPIKNLRIKDVRKL